jgi:glycosyltransferase involved in cell wall biosynthesis
MIKDFRKKTAEIDIDTFIVIDFYNPTFWQFMAEKKKRKNTKLFVWSETRNWPNFLLSRWFAYFFWWYFKKNIKHVEKVFVFSNEGKKFFNTLAPEVAVEVFPAPIDSTTFYLDNGKKWLPEVKLRILMNARFIPLKEHKTLFDAVATLKAKDILVQVSLIGRGGHIKNELLAYADKIGILPQITVLDTVTQEELRAVYLAHDVLVLPSNREAIGMVVPEAMACGLPTITSKAVGANTYVVEGKTGFIFQTGNSEALAKNLEQLIEPGVAKQMGMAAAKEIVDKYTIEILGSRMLTVLNQTAASIDHKEIEK